MEPCTKEESINKLYDFHEQKLRQLVEIEKRQISIGADVAHIKSRIDNGMSHTIADVHKNLTDIVPIIQRFVSFEKRWEDFCWWVYKICAVILIALVIWAISKGFLPKIGI